MEGRERKKYEYDVFSIDARPPRNDEGNYIFARRGIFNSAVWMAVYVGQGKLQDRYDAAIGEGCVQKKRATHYHRHYNSSKADRLSEEKDIIEGNDACKAPRGCNGQD